MSRYESVKHIKEDKLSKAKENILKESKTLDGWPEIEGYDFEEDFNINKFLDSFLLTGFQATHLGEAINIIREMRKNNATIFLAFTSNMGTCGVREIIKYLFKYKFIHVASTTVGAIEEDIMKVFKPFVLGDYRAPGKVLREDGVNRTGNIFVPNDRYLYFERFMNPFLERLYNEYTLKGKIIDITKFVYEMGRELELRDIENRESSFTYWAYKNDVPLFSPALPDGSVGDMLYFFKKNHPDFKIDTSDYIVEVTDLALNSEKMGIIAIGGSVPKHLVANAGLFRDGVDYAVYINTGLEMEGSNAGAPIDEAVSWGKIKPDALKIKVEAEASIIFPIIVLGAFKLFNIEEDVKEVREKKGESK